MLIDVVVTVVLVIHVVLTTARWLSMLMMLFDVGKRCDPRGAHNMPLVAYAMA